MGIIVESPLGVKLIGGGGQLGIAVVLDFRCGQIGRIHANLVQQKAYLARHPYGVSLTVGFELVTLFLSKQRRFLFQVDIRESNRGHFYSFERSKRAGTVPFQANNQGFSIGMSRQ